MVDGLVRGPAECFRSCAQTLTNAGFEMPPWRLLAQDEEVVRADDPEPNEPKFGSQQKANRALHKKFCQEVHLPRLSELERAMMRSQHGPLASSALTAVRGSAKTSGTLIAPVLTHLPMWPPTRSSWPPSRSVLRGRGSGKKGVSTRVPCSAGLSRTKGTSDHASIMHSMDDDQRSLLTG